VTFRRKYSLCEGYGPTVSVGVTAHPVPVTVPLSVVVVVLVVVLVDVALGLVGVSPPHAAVITAPAAPSSSSACRRFRRRGLGSCTVSTLQVIRGLACTRDAMAVPPIGAEL